jgi:hypothetical protein
MHPKLHMSEAVSYCFSIIEISGALYHLEPTCKDINLFWFFLLGLSSSKILERVASCYSTVSVRLISSLSFNELRLSDEVTLPGSDLAKPKSQTFTWHLLSSRMFAGLMSLCIMLQKCTNEIAKRQL